MSLSLGRLAFSYEILHECMAPLLVCHYSKLMKMAFSSVVTQGAVLKAMHICREAEISPPFHSAIVKIIPLALAVFRRAPTFELCVEGLLIGLDIYYSSEEEEEESDQELRIQRTCFGALMGIGAATLYRALVAAQFRSVLGSALRVDRLLQEGGIFNYAAPIGSSLFAFFEST